MPLPPESFREFRWVRRTSFLAEQQAVGAGSLTLRGQSPAAPALVEITLIGPDLTGTVTVTGTLAGASVVETFTFTGPVANQRATQTGCKRLDVVTSITTSGLSDEATTPQIVARWVGAGGEAVEANEEVEAELCGYLEVSRGTWPRKSGTAVEKGWIGLDDWYDELPRRGDVLVEQRDDADYRRWEVVGLPDHLGNIRPHHHELTVELRDTTDVEIRSP